MSCKVLLQVWNIGLAVRAFEGHWFRDSWSGAEDIGGEGTLALACMCDCVSRCRYCRECAEDLGSPVLPAYSGHVGALRLLALMGGFAVR